MDVNAVQTLVNEVIPKMIIRIKALETQVAELAAGIAKKPGTRSRSKKATEEKTAQPATGWTSTAKDPRESVVDMGLIAELDKKYDDTPQAQAQARAPADYLNEVISIGEYNYRVDQQSVDNVKAALTASKGNVEAAAAALQTPVEYVHEVARIAMERKQR